MCTSCASYVSQDIGIPDVNGRWKPRLAAKDNMKLVKYDLKNDSLEEFEEDVYTLCRLIAR